MEGFVFLDFDGVICDSVLECLVSSWHGYFHFYLKKEAAAVPLTLREQFSALRPFVRAGEDFMLVQEILANRTPVRCQAEFDALAEEKGRAQMERFKELFYAARSSILEKQRRYWIGLNRIYPQAKETLERWASSPCLYILSTKRAEYILEILAANDLHIDPDRVLSCGALEKRPTMLTTLEKHGVDAALFIDDQIDYLSPEGWQGPRIVACLASWGYVKEQWLREPHPVEILQPEQLEPRIAEWLCRCPQPRNRV